MASKFIKIFNDTVLKQTVLQGYELQRSNENLGQICMGELAFTRDTGRLFVGNFSTQELELDIKHINGGVLTGNKYIGLIDSRPLCHFNGNGTTGCYPLNYEKNTEDRVENKVYPDEIGLFLSGSRYRPYEQNASSFRLGGDGWNKKPEYIQKYGVYSGDYTFDIYNNALILFDKNIKLNTGETKLITETTTDPETGETVINEWKETEINGGKLIWNGTEESIKNNQDTDVTYTATLRSPISNIADPDENISQYPIYGDGYVIMRILEPDGITIDYADKKFQDGEPVQTTDNTNTLSYPNWTHNILTVKYPLDKILESFDQTNFHKGTNGISLGAFQTIPNESEEKENFLSITLPNKISITDSGWIKENGEDKRISFRPLKDYNNSDFEENNPFDDIEENNLEKDSCYLTITKNGQIRYKSPKSVFTHTDYEEIKKEFKRKTYTIHAGDGLEITNIDNTSETYSNITLGDEDSNWKISLKPDEYSIEQTQNGYNPWGLDDGGTYNYSGTCGFYNGYLKTTNEYEEKYKTQEEFKKVVTDIYESDKLVSINYLKTPYILHAGSSDSKAQFINLPYIACTGSSSGTISVPSISKNTSAVTKTETDVSEEIVTENNEDGKEVTITTTYESIYDTTYYYNVENVKVTENQTYHRVPNHAHSVLLQVINSGALKLYTNYDYNTLSTSSKCILDIKNAGCHVVELPLHDGLHILTKKLIQLSINGETQTLEEGQDEPEEEISKSFQYYVSTSSNFTINLLGYRV